MKTIHLVITLVIVLLAGSFSSPAAHAMPMTNSIGSVSEGAPSQHDCCDETEQQSMQKNCEQQSSFCQHCERHCAGQIGLITLLTDFIKARFIPSYAWRNLPLWQRTERLIRPPKLVVA